MNCPSCGTANPALAQRCSSCGAGLSRPKDAPQGDPDQNTLVDKDPNVARKEPNRAAPGSSTSAGAKANPRTQPEDWRNAHVIAKTPSGFGMNNPLPPAPEDAGTLYDDSPLSHGKTPALSGARAYLSVLGGLEPGADFGPRFRIEQLLGEGGMGKVYKALDKELGRTVALKILQPELTKDPAVVLRFKQELLLASKISHKNILRIHDLSDFEGVKFITMAYIEGQDLNELLKKTRPLPIERAMNIGRQLCEALDAAHTEGVIHRDFKPHNVLVAHDDHVYVSDFGLATSLETAKMGMTRTGAFVGTPRYMSPEQVEGKHVDSRSDLYSLGLVLYEMVCGEVPFSGESTWQVMYQRVKEAPKNVKVINCNVPDAVSEIIMHCLERDPANRYQSAKEIIADIDAQRSPNKSLTSMYRPQADSRTLQFTVPATPPKWLYVAGALLVSGGLFFAIPQTRHLVIKPTVESRVGGGDTVGTLPPVSQGRYVAVLPFRVLGDASSLGYVGEGLGEALSTKLFQLKEIHVTSPSEVGRIDPKTPPAQIAKKLGANLMVQGVVQGNSQQMRITVKLENVAEGKTVWSDEFSGAPGDLLSIEDKISAKLAEALQTDSAEIASGQGRPTDNVDAYDSYLRGRNALRGEVNKKNIQSAIDLFKAALKQDPKFALAYTGLADASLRMYEEDKSSLWTDKALVAAKEAQALNDQLPEVHFALGDVYSVTGQTTEAIRELKRALELAPNSDEGYRRLGNAYMSAGKKNEAIQALNKAVQLNPYYWKNLNALGGLYLQSGDYDKALKLYQQVTELEPQNADGFSNVGSVYIQMGRYEESIPPLETAYKLDPNAGVVSNLGTSYFYLQRYSDAVKQFERAAELNPADPTVIGNLADAYRWAGQPDKAKDTYQKAIALSFKSLSVNQNSATTLCNLAELFVKKGDPAQATTFLQRARSSDPSLVDLHYAAALIDVATKRPEEAVAEIRKALQQGYAVTNIDTDPEFGSLRDRPDYQALLAQYSEKKK